MMKVSAFECKTALVRSAGAPENIGSRFYHVEANDPLFNEKMCWSPILEIYRIRRNSPGAKVFRIAERGFMGTRVCFAEPREADIQLDETTMELSGKDAQGLFEHIDIAFLFAFQNSEPVAKFLESDKLFRLEKGGSLEKWNGWNHVKTGIEYLGRQGSSDILGCDHDESMVYHFKINDDGSDVPA